MLTSKVQRNALGRKPRSSVVILLPYSSSLVRNSYRRRRIRRIRRKDEMRKMSWTFSMRWHIFYALACFRVKEWVSSSSVYCALSPRPFYSPGFHSVGRWCWFYIVLWYTNNHYHPYIDSTTVLCDVFVHISKWATWSVL